jgi:hypothetical protein
MIEVLLVDDITGIGQSDGGENLAIAMKFKNSIEKTILLPIGILSGFITALFAAGSEAYRQKLGRLGTNQAMLDVTSFASFAPTSYSLARGNDMSTQEDTILVRLNKHHAPVVDVVLDLATAKRLGTALIAAAEAQAPAPPSAQRLQ